MSDIWKQLLIQLILILLNAFFAATEIALISINEKKVRSLAEEGNKKALKMLKIIEDPTKFLSAIQIGITLAGFLGSAFAADSFADKLTGAMVSAFNIPPDNIGIIDTISVIVITLILSYFTLVLGELVPKRIAMRHKEKLANGVCGIMSVITTILKPIIWFLTISTNIVLRLFGINPNEKDESVSEEDIVLMLDAGADDGTIDKENIKYIKNVFKLDGMIAKDVMTPRTNVVSLSDNATDDEIVTLLEKEGFSRVPIYNGTVDNIIGILYAREYLLNRHKPDFQLKNIIKSPICVPETKHLDDLFREMKTTQNHIVVLVDEYGMTAGIVTMEDILEQLVGEIWDEEDEVVEFIIKENSNEYRVKTSLSIDTFFESFHLSNVEEIESSTVNGWIIETMECIPTEGTTFNYENLIVTILKADNTQTEEIKVKVLSEKETDK